MSAGHLELELRQYLGDGVYVGSDGFQLWLYTSDGMTVQNRIALEPNVLKNLIEYVDRNCERGEEFDV